MRQCDLVFGVMIPRLIGLEVEYQIDMQFLERTS
jgi:hypothetical protein